MCKHYFLLVFFIFISSILSAQPPVYPRQWQSDEQTGFILNPYSIENNKPQFHSFSNALGTHVIVRNLDGSTVENEYRLIGNNGQTYAIGSFGYFNHSDLRIAAFEDKIYVFTFDKTNNRLVGRIGEFAYDPGNPANELSISSWSNTVTFDPGVTDVEITDLATDFRGIHLVYQDQASVDPIGNTQNEVYYVRYNPAAGKSASAGLYPGFARYFAKNCPSFYSILRL